MHEQKRLFWLSDANTAHTRRWVKALADRNYRVLVFSLAEPDFDWAADIPNVDLVSAGYSTAMTYSQEGGIRKLRYLQSVPQVRKLARSFRPDLCHAHYVSSYGIIATLAGLRPRVVSVWGADVYSAPSRSRLLRFGIRSVLERADRILSTSNVMRSKTRELTDRPIAVVPFGIDTSRFSPAGRDGGDARLKIGTIKSLEPKYGMEFLLRAFARVLEDAPQADVELVIVGAGTLEASLRSLADELRVAERTRFSGRVDYDDVHRCHQELDIAVYPSIEDSESFGVSVIESQACGKPVIVSRVGGLPEVVDEGVTGLVVPPMDVAALADALQTLLGDAEKRLQFGLAGRRRVEQHYSLDACVDLLLAEYSGCSTVAS